MQHGKPRRLNWSKKLASSIVNQLELEKLCLSQKLAKYPEKTFGVSTILELTNNQIADSTQFIDWIVLLSKELNFEQLPNIQ